MFMVTGEIQQINKKLDELINFLVSQFDRVEKRLTSLEKVQDHILGELKTLNEDKEVGAYRSHRMESWIVRASKKIDLPYNR